MSVRRVIAKNCDQDTTSRVLVATFETFTKTFI